MSLTRSPPQPESFTGHFLKEAYRGHAHSLPWHKLGAQINTVELNREPRMSETPKASWSEPDPSPNSKIALSCQTDKEH